MAALLIVGALAIADKVEQKKEKKRAKKANDEKRYRELQLETNRRLSGTTTTDAALIDNSEGEEEPEENVKVAGDDVPPPAYEDAVQAGARREAEWKAQMAQRRRSSVHSQRSGGSGVVARERYMRMG